MQITRSKFQYLVLILAIFGLLAACSPTEAADIPVALPELEIATATTETALEPTETQASVEEPTEVVAEATDAAPSEPASQVGPQIPDGDFRTWTKVAEDFSQPLLLTNAADGSNRLFVVDQQGRIWILQNGQILEQPFLDIRGRVNSDGNEQGLLGLAFHPNFEENGYFYVDYTNSTPATVIARFQITEDGNLADAQSEKILLTINQPYSNHNGGHLEFGPDGYLYIAMGDGGSAGDPQSNGQNVNTLLGSILRIDVDGGDPYAIPADNPYANGGGAPEIWVSGLRNPWRFSFDSLTGDLYIGDVGQNSWEEIDFLPGGVVGGVNFGWNYYEANHKFNSEPPANVSIFPPVTEYHHDNGRCSITGGNVYRGEKMPELYGVYFYGDFCSGEVFALVQQNEGLWVSEAVYNLPLLITSFGTDEYGEIYLLDRNGGLYNLR